MFRAIYLFLPHMGSRTSFQENGKPIISIAIFWCQTLRNPFLYHHPSLHPLHNLSKHWTHKRERQRDRDTPISPSVAQPIQTLNPREDKKNARVFSVRATERFMEMIYTVFEGNSVILSNKYVLTCNQKTDVPSTRIRALNSISNLVPCAHFSNRGKLS